MKLDAEHFPVLKYCRIGKPVSFDPCLPCGVHMYLGNGKIVETRHSPTFGNLNP